jgi:cytochrome P450
VISSCETLIFDPYDYQAHENPYPLCRRLRTEAPLYRNDERDFWALSRHADVLRGFRDSSALSNANGISVDKSAFGPKAQRTMSFLAMDDPSHLRLRTLVSKGFTPRHIRELQPQVNAGRHRRTRRRRFVVDPCLGQPRRDSPGSVFRRRRQSRVRNCI